MYILNKNTNKIFNCRFKTNKIHKFLKNQYKIILKEIIKKVYKILFIKEISIVNFIKTLIRLVSLLNSPNLIIKDNNINN